MQRIFLFLLFSLFFTGCLFFKNSELKKEQDFYGNFTKREEKQILSEPKRLLTDYSDMTQNFIVSWIWSKPGFVLTHCRTVSVSPILNYSPYNYPWAEGKIVNALKELFSSICKSHSGSTDIVVSPAIVDMKPEKNFISRLFPFKEDSPFIEIEIVIFDADTNAILYKVCHYKKGEDFREAINGIIKDLEEFFLQKKLNESK